MPADILAPQHALRIDAAHDLAEHWKLLIRLLDLLRAQPMLLGPVRPPAVRRADLGKTRLEDAVRDWQPVGAVRDDADPARPPPVTGRERDIVGGAPPNLDGEVDTLARRVGGFGLDVVAQCAQAVGGARGVERPFRSVLRELGLVGERRERGERRVEEDGDGGLTRQSKLNTLYPSSTVTLCSAASHQAQRPT